ncbi:hypothetical protein ABW19_dt0202058 [Dactylella cylindrospora]|nr:hypothetical protein ABW19_dt0202058 [Dactylella cylindrospora]
MSRDRSKASKLRSIFSGKASKEPKDPEPNPNILDIRFAWENRQSNASPLDIDGGQSDSESPARGLTNENKPETGPKTSSENRMVTSSQDGKQVQQSGQKMEEGLHTQQQPTTFSDHPKENSLQGHLFRPKPKVLSLLNEPEYKSGDLIPAVIYNVIPIPKGAANMVKTQAYVYMDKTAVISILNTLEYAHPILSEVFLHTQISTSHNSRLWTQEVPLSDFLEAFIDPTIDPVLSNKLGTYWWTLECALENGSITIHSLSQSTYSHVYIFKFSPITGLFTGLFSWEMENIREYLQGHPNDSTFFPKATSMPLSERQKLRTQLTGGLGLASRSMTNLANLLPSPFPKRSFTPGSLATMQLGGGNAAAEGILTRLKDAILPTLQAWNTFSLEGSAFGNAFFNNSNPDISSPNASPKSRSKRPGFLRSSSGSYLKHPMQMLRHASGSSVSISLPSESHMTAESLQMITPAIIVTTPGKETRILKLKETVTLKPIPTKAKGFFKSGGHRQQGPPTFVFWKDAFEILKFETFVPPHIRNIKLDLDTNVNDQVGIEFKLLLDAINEMYSDSAEGLQLDFARFKAFPIEKERGPIEFRRFQGIHHASSFNANDSLGANPNIKIAPARADPPTSPGLTQGVIKKLTLEDFPGPDDIPAGDTDRHSLAFTDDFDADPEEIKGQDQEPSKIFKRDEKLTIGFEVKELEFSSCFVTPDSFAVEAIIAGWFADSARWIQHSELQWRNTLLERSTRNS